jgi:signal transduction histidine kinase
VDYRLESRPQQSIEATVYFVVAEALTNVAKYAAASEVTVTLTRTGPTTLILKIDDDGIGGADATRGSGLRGLADRVAVVDGTLDVSSPPGGGTTITCQIPLSMPRPSDAAPASGPIVTPVGAGA